MNTAPPNPHTHAIALLGRRDEPTDGVEDYCHYLGLGLAKHGWTLEPLRMPWPQQGWRAALGWLWREAEPWRGRWVLVQYTALAWSGRAIPLGVLAMLWILRRRGVRCAVVFHDMPYPGNRWLDRVRRSLQIRIMRAAYRGSACSILTLPLDKAGWLPSSHAKASFIPIGANIPSLDDLLQEGWAPLHESPAGSPPTVAVFGVTDSSAGARPEVDAIICALRAVASRLGELRLLVLGRGAQEAQAAFETGLSGSPVSLTICGVLPGREISIRLASCDVLLFVRSGLSSRRGGGLAGIACGVPMVAYEGEETGFPLVEGGIHFVPKDDLALLADGLTKVLADSDLRLAMRARNQALYREWFSWDRIAEKFIQVLTKGNPR